MKRKTLLIWSLFVCSFSGCSAGNDPAHASDDTTLGSQTASIASDCTRQPDGSCGVDPKVAEWTFMVYLNADNNLESYGFDNLAQMESVGSTDKVKIVVLMDTASANSGHARRLLVNKGGSTVLADVGELDMGAPETLAEFGVWAVKAFPARHYALVLWDHGSGWGLAPGGVVKEFSNDDSSGNSISIAEGEYAAALKPVTDALGRRLDVVGFDACLMGMWELANATQAFADVLVASEETEPGEGWPYDRLLSPLAANPMLSAKDLAASIVDGYSAAGEPTQASIDLSRVDQLNVAVSALADALAAAAPSQRRAIDAARAASLSFTIGENHDLYDFAVRVSAISGISADVCAAAQEVIGQVGAAVLDNKTVGADYKDAHGLAIYLPASGSKLDPAYRGAGANWSERSTWDEFLAAF